MPVNQLSGVSLKTLEDYRKNFLAEGKNLLSQAVCIRQNPLDVLRKPDRERLAHVFTHKVNLLYKSFPCRKFIRIQVKLCLQICTV